VNFAIGQLVVYPNHGIGVIERINRQQCGSNALSMYEMRLAFNNETIRVPIENAGEVGLRLPISQFDCQTLFDALAEDFDAISADWRLRYKQYSEILRRGDLFEVADVLKKLTFLNQIKPLSFRERRLLDKARYLVVSEIAAVCRAEECATAKRIDAALQSACEKHCRAKTCAASAAATIH
jgi:CarD family transcriptional regulator